jgi:choline dehydrogenase-like flavoprotein
MLIDARELPVDKILETEICIIGAGPAGIALAREFNGQDFQVCLLESGGLTDDPAIQALAEDAGMPIGDWYKRAHKTRRRVFGGTSTVWPISMGNGKKGVRYVPLSPIDFEKREGIPYSGWPITKEDLDPYYERAHAVCQSGPYTYKLEDWEDERNKSISFKGDRVKTQIFQFGPRDIFSHDYRQELEESKNITVCLNGTALELETDALAKTVSQVHVGTLNGNRFKVKARIFVLAAGGLEVARLLLVSNSVQKAGLGNENDLVGRFLMDHPVVRSGVLIPFDRQVINSLGLYDTRVVNGAMVTAKPVLSEKVMREEKLLNICTALYPRSSLSKFNLLRSIFPKGRRFRSPAIESLVALKTAFDKKKLPQKALSQIINLLTGIDDLIYFQWRRGYGNRINRTYHFDDGGWSKLSNKTTKFGCFEVFHFTEQSPDPNNRVALSEDKDVFGYPKIQMFWRWNDIDIQSIKNAQIILAEEFLKAGIGQLKIELDHGVPQVFLPSIHHHIGTTRMHEDPKQGVVNADCQVHGTSNLYIASSSVFTTGGFANPTLTIVAMAIRTADKIKSELSK